MFLSKYKTPISKIETKRIYVDCYGELTAINRHSMDELDFYVGGLYYNFEFDVEAHAISLCDYPYPIYDENHNMIGWGEDFGLKCLMVETYSDSGTGTEFWLIDDISYAIFDDNHQVIASEKIRLDFAINGIGGIE